MNQFQPQEAEEDRVNKMAKKKQAQKINFEDKNKVPISAESKSDLIAEEDTDKAITEKVIAELKKIKEEVLGKSKDKNKTDLTPEEKFNLLQNFAIQKVKDNKILQTKIEKEVEAYKKNKNLEKRNANKNKSTIDKAKQQIRKVIVAYIEYYSDVKSKVYNWIELTKKPPLIVNAKLREVFLMDSPAKFLNGKPVYILIHGIPFSIPMDFFYKDLYMNMENMPELDKDNKGKPIFGRAYLSSIDLYAIFTSIKTILLFGIKRSILKSIFAYVVCFLLGMMTLYIFLSPYLFK